MFNKMQLQHKQRFGMNPEAAATQEPVQQINTYDKAFAKPQA